MAASLTLRKNTTPVMDLLTGDLRVKVDGWQMQSGNAVEEPIWDTLYLVGRAATEASLGTAIYNVQNFVAEASQAANNTSRDDRYWLYYQSAGGTAARTLVIDGKMELLADPGFGGLGPLINSDGFVYANLALQHSSWWESGTVTSSAAGITISTTGGEYGPGSAFCGDLPGRIQSFSLSDAGTTPLDDFWIGIRPTYEGTANFAALWEFESGSAATGGGGSAIATAGASNGTAVRVDFSGTAAMYHRWTIGVANVIGAGTANHYTGKYLVLGRLKCGASTECLIDLYHGLSQVGYSGTPAGIELVGETKVTNTAWKLIELGQVQFPPFGKKVLEDSTYGTAADAALYIYAQRLSGSSYLYLDCIVLMPCEHLLTIKNAGLNNSADIISFRMGADGKTICMMKSGTEDKSEIIEHSVNTFYYPPDGGDIVIAAQGTASHSIGATIGMQYKIFPRFSLIRLT